MTEGDTLKKLRELSGHLVDPDVAVGIFELLPDAIVVVDQQAKIQLVNRQAEFMFGYNRREMFDQHINILVPEEVRERHTVHLDRFMEDPRMRPMGIGLKLSGRRRNGATFPVEINLSPLSTAFGLLVVAVIRRVRSEEV